MDGAKGDSRRTAVDVGALPAPLPGRRYRTHKVFPPCTAESSVPPWCAVEGDIRWTEQRETHGELQLMWAHFPLPCPDADIAPTKFFLRAPPSPLCLRGAQLKEISDGRSKGRLTENCS